MKSTEWSLAAPNRLPCFPRPKNKLFLSWNSPHALPTHSANITLPHCLLHTESLEQLTPLPDLCTLAHLTNKTFLRQVSSFPSFCSNCHWSKIKSLPSTSVEDLLNHHVKHISLFSEQPLVQTPLGCLFPYIHMRSNLLCIHSGRKMPRKVSSHFNTRSFLLTVDLFSLKL